MNFLNKYLKKSKKNTKKKNKNKPATTLMKINIEKQAAIVRKKSKKGSKEGRKR